MSASAAISCPEPELPRAAYVPMNSCTIPRRHGSVPYGGFSRNLPCYPPLSHGSTRYEVDDLRFRGSELPAGGSVSLFTVKDCGPSNSPSSLCVWPADTQSCRRGSHSLLPFPSCSFLLRSLCRFLCPCQVIASPCSCLHSRETSWKDNPPTGGRPVRRVLPCHHPTVARHSEVEIVYVCDATCLAWASTGRQPARSKKLPPWYAVLSQLRLGRTSSSFSKCEQVEFPSLHGVSLRTADRQWQCEM